MSGQGGKSTKQQGGMDMHPCQGSSQSGHCIHDWPHLGPAAQCPWPQKGTNFGIGHVRPRGEIHQTTRGNGHASLPRKQPIRPLHPRLAPSWPSRSVSVAKKKNQFWDWPCQAKGGNPPNNKGEWTCIPAKEAANQATASTIGPILAQLLSVRGQKKEPILGLAMSGQGGKSTKQQGGMDMHPCQGSSQSGHCIHDWPHLGPDAQCPWPKKGTNFGIGHVRGGGEIHQTTRGTGCKNWAAKDTFIFDWPKLTHLICAIGGFKLVIASTRPLCVSSKCTTEQPMTGKSSKTGSPRNCLQCSRKNKTNSNSHPLGVNLKFYQNTVP